VILTRGSADRNGKKTPKHDFPPALQVPATTWPCASPVVTVAPCSCTYRYPPLSSLALQPPISPCDMLLQGQRRWMIDDRSFLPRVRAHVHLGPMHMKPGQDAHPYRPGIRVFPNAVFTNPLLQVSQPLSRTTPLPPLMARPAGCYQGGELGFNQVRNRKSSNQAHHSHGPWRHLTGKTGAMNDLVSRRLRV
jgi:hypothetical protein